jgi:predicted MPP superfamily phosphohydrolase
MRRRRKRRGLRTFCIILVLIAAAGIFFCWQQRSLTEEEIAVFSDRLPDAFEGFRISVVSDLHGMEFGEGNARLLRAVREQEPDLIAVTGDVVDDPEQLAILPALARGLTAIAPTYYGTGNHEWATRKVPEIISILEQCGVTVLQNESIPLEQDGQRIILAGIHDPNGRSDQKQLPQLAEELRAEYEDPFVLLLAHRNTYFATYARCEIDLTLAGHGHGGIIRLPFTDGLISTDRTLFPTWTSGLYELDGAQMVVSRGLGNTPGFFRLFNRPHLPLVVLHGAES